MSRDSKLTVKVVKGSFWVLMGQVLPLVATFLASPFVIRWLGSEAYGVLILLGLISTYFAFGDFGMVMASTRYGSEAYASGSPSQEGATIRTAALIGISSSLVIAIPLFFFPEFVMGTLFRVPPNLLPEASIGLRFIAGAYVMNFIGNIFNTPQLSRMRQDLNVLINSGFRILMTLSTPIILYLGGGIIETSILAFTTAFLIMSANILVSAKLLPQMLQWSIDREKIKPLLKFGSNLALYSIGLLITNNVEKVLLTRSSVRELGYYSVASTFSTMATFFSMAMVQTLIPAFSQLLSPDKREELRLLFDRCVKIGLIGVIPSVMILLIIARPFFTIWAGEEYGMNSIYPFYILLAGVFFSLLVYVPNTILLASGRSYLFARFYLLEIIPYSALAYVLIRNFGGIGAALAWSIRETFNAFVFIYYTRRHTGLTLRIHEKISGIFLGFLVFLPTAIIALLANEFTSLVFLCMALSLVAYVFIVWHKLVESAEKQFVLSRLSFLKKRNVN